MKTNNFKFRVGDCLHDCFDDRSYRRTRIPYANRNNYKVLGIENDCYILREASDRKHIFKCYASIIDSVFEWGERFKKISNEKFNRTNYLFVGVCPYAIPA